METKLLIFSKLSGGGLDRFFQLFYQLKTENFDIFYFFYNPPIRKEIYKNTKYRIIKPNLRYENDFIIFWPIKFIFFINHLIRTFFILKNYKKKYKKIVVLSADLYSLAILALLKNLLPFSLVFRVMVDFEELLLKRGILFRKLIHLVSIYAINKADKVVSVSKGLSIKTKNFFKINSTSKTTFIYNGVIFNVIKKPRLYPKQNPVILYVGRLDKEKDLQTIVKSFYFVIIKRSDCQLWIVGDGSEREKISKLIKNIGLQKNIKMFGWKNNVEEFYKRAHIFCFASFYEGFGFVIIEAMSFGLPVVVTNSPFGPGEIIEDNKYGLLVPVQDYKKMSNEILSLLSSKEKYIYYSKRSLKRAKFFSKEKMLSEWKKVFQELI
ncbi:MAG: hypothetical protein KatS3mg091_661 [Patescibacteria group bacterium]|nr:MAG: hypothetical protein KatS3mg090_0008 [Patescibacteria group bacterium]GIW63859.1 MAG: hypothetical protein KatS3mg091_661 [Patescibacteria group bacterium]GIW65016.1 MAG: hypothetical protein KatS3mg092_0949 [Patescibacteria group bacterium]